GGLSADVARGGGPGGGQVAEAGAAGQKGVGPLEDVLGLRVVAAGNRPGGLFQTLAGYLPGLCNCLVLSVGTYGKDRDAGRYGAEQHSDGTGQQGRTRIAAAPAP